MEKTVGVLFIDFRKASVTVDHAIRKHKLQLAGFLENITITIQDYLNNRLRFAEIDGSFSTNRRIEYGVPQGSLLGPRLFLIYIDDFPEAPSKGRLKMCTDDTTAYCVGSTINEVFEDLQTMLWDIHQW